MKNKISLSYRILRYLRQKGDWISGGEIEALTMGAGYKASNGSRRCREMESGKLSDGRTCPIVLLKKVERGTVYYKALPPKSVEVFKVNNEVVYTKKLY